MEQDWTLTPQDNSTGIRIAVVCRKGTRTMRIDNALWKTQQEALESVRGTIDRLEQGRGKRAPSYPGGEGAG